MRWRGAGAGAHRTATRRPGSTAALWLSSCCTRCGCSQPGPTLVLCPQLCSRVEHHQLAALVLVLLHRGRGSRLYLLIPCSKLIKTDRSCAESPSTSVQCSPHTNARRGARAAPCSRSPAPAAYTASDTGPAAGAPAGAPSTSSCATCSLSAPQSRGWRRWWVLQGGERQSRTLAVRQQYGHVLRQQWWGLQTAGR